MDSEKGMLLLMGSQVGLTGAGIAASRQQYKTDREKIKTEAAVAKERNAAESYKAAREFRQSLSSQLALASLRSMGGGSIMRQFGSQAMGTAYADQAEFERRARLIDVQQGFSLAEAKSARRAREMQGIGQLLQSGVSALNFSASASPTTDGKGGA